MRAHIIVPEELIQSVDKLIGPRSRSKFFVEAAEERLSKIRRAKLARKLAGSLARITIPEWRTTETTAQWIRNSRKTDEEKLKKLHNT